MPTRKAIKAAPAVKTRVRVAVEEVGAPAPSYFASGSEKDNIQFTSTGCCLFDEALGGGPALGRGINIVGDKSAGKTLLAMEIMAQTLLRFPGSWARYAESEAAWDAEYASALGLPVDQIELNPNDERIETVEQLYDDMERCLDKHKGTPGGVYVIDSLDALSDEAEMEAGFNEASYGGAKPKAIGQLFRRLVGRFEEQNVLLVVISQLRDKLNVTFGETKTRSGGRALDFYMTHIVWLAEIEKLKRTIGGVDRIVGIQVEAYVKKNKVGLAFRKARYPILFGYGIDDLMASAAWLVEIKRERLLYPLGMKRGEAAVKVTRARVAKKSDVGKAKVEEEEPKELRPYKEVILEVRNKGGAEAREMREKLSALVRQEWARIETTFLPQAKKY